MKGCAGGSDFRSGVVDATTAHGPALLPNNKVIVIDDDPSVLKGLARVLKMSGFDPVVFGSAESFENEGDIGEACCLVVDIHLKGKSGLELKQRLGDQLPVIFITASDSDAVSAAAGEAGCIALLHKPFPAQSLIDPIRHLSAGTHRRV
jgi:FixJ family two-component response regulator